jgi:hypothetical protein
MNMQPIFDTNIYNKYLYYSGGQHPNFYQYQQFVNNLYYNNYFQYQNVLLQSPPLPSEPLPSAPLPSAPLPSVPSVPDQNKQNNCIKGMGCKNIKCTDYHHPSKDLDILNEIRKN